MAKKTNGKIFSESSLLKTKMWLLTVGLYCKYLWLLYVAVICPALFPPTKIRVFFRHPINSPNRVQKTTKPTEHAGDQRRKLYILPYHREENIEREKSMTPRFIQTNIIFLKIYLQILAIYMQTAI